MQINAILGVIFVHYVQSWLFSLQTARLYLLYFYITMLLVLGNKKHTIFTNTSIATKQSLYGIPIDITKCKNVTNLRLPVNIFVGNHFPAWFLSQLSLPLGVYNIIVHQSNSNVWYQKPLPPYRGRIQRDWTNHYGNNLLQRYFGIRLYVIIHNQQSITARYFDNFYLNLISPSAAYMRQWIGSALIQIVACRLFNAKPLFKPILGCCLMDP